MKHRKARNHHCARCGRRYYRCNRVHLWDGQNPGKRDGWSVKDDAYCLDCTPVRTVQKILVVAATATIAPTRHLHIVRTGQQRRRA